MYGRPEKYRFPLLNVIPNKDLPPILIPNLNDHEEDIIQTTEALTGRPLDKMEPARTLEQDFDVLANRGRTNLTKEGGILYINPPRCSQKRKDSASLCILEDVPLQKRPKMV